MATKQNAINTVLPFLTTNGGTGAASVASVNSVMVAGTSTTAALKTSGTPGSIGNIFGTRGTSFNPSFGLFGLAGLYNIAVATAASSAEVVFSNLLPSSMTNWVVIYNNLVMDTAGDKVYCYIGTGASPSWKTTGYRGTNGLLSNSTQTSTSGNNPLFLNNGGTSNTSTTGDSGYVFLSQGTGSPYPTFYSIGSGYQNSLALRGPIVSTCAWQTNSEALTSVKFTSNGNTIKTGTFRLYGVKE